MRKIKGTGRANTWAHAYLQGKASICITGEKKFHGQLSKRESEGRPAEMRADGKTMTSQPVKKHPTDKAKPPRTIQSVGPKKKEGRQHTRMTISLKALRRRQELRASIRRVTIAIQQVQENHQTRVGKRNEGMVKAKFQIPTEKKGGEIKTPASPGVKKRVHEGIAAIEGPNPIVT